MASTSNKEEEDKCECGTDLPDNDRYCPTCTADIGAPNVRISQKQDNLKAIQRRFNEAKNTARNNNVINQLEELINKWVDKTGVVISMPAPLARSLIQNPSELYKNYEELADENMRQPASLENDRIREIVGSTLFGSYKKRIIYGALSLTHEGLPTYGTIHCRLRSSTIQKRTSFLETNSYKFVEDHNITAKKPIPLGYISSWDDRNILALIKIVNKLSNNQTESELQTLLINSDGKDRNNDEFIEAHIYDNFDSNAIENMIKSNSDGLSREERMDQTLAIVAFKKARNI